MPPLNHAEAALIAALLRPRVQTLADLLQAQVQALPPGDAAWIITREELNTAAAALHKIEEEAEA